MPHVQDLKDSHALPFAHVKNDISRLKDLDPNTTGVISVIGKLKQKSEMQVVLCGEKKGQQRFLMLLSMMVLPLIPYLFGVIYKMIYLNMGYLNGPKLLTSKMPAT